MSSVYGVFLILGSACLLGSYLLYPAAMHAVSVWERWLGIGRQRDLMGETALRRVDSVAVLMAAYNEDGVIESRIDNILKQASGEASVELVVVCDACTDGTVEKVRAAASGNRSIKCVENLVRKGKNHCLNTALECTEADVYVYTDANTHFIEGALEGLIHEIERGADCVSGIERSTDNEGVAGLSAKYLDMEANIKRGQSLVGGFFSCNGSIMAVTRSHAVELPDDSPNDLYLPLACLAHGGRVVFSDRAVAVESPSHDLYREYMRRKRIVSRSAACVRRLWGALPLWVRLNLVAHKVGRWLGVGLGCAFMVGLVGLLDYTVASPIAAFLFVLIAVLPAVIEEQRMDRMMEKVANRLRGRHGKWVQAVMGVFLLQYGAWVGFLHGINGRGQVIWGPAR